MFKEGVTELGRDRYRARENTDANWLPMTLAVSILRSSDVPELFRLEP